MTEAFEEIVAVLLEAEGYWVRRNVKIKLSPEQVQMLGLKSVVCELDLVAYRKSAPEQVLIVECKSFGRSGGITWKTYQKPDKPTTRRHRYKLFWSQPLQAEIVSLLQSNEITPQVPHIYCLASTATDKGSHQQIRDHLHANGMQFFDRAWLSKGLLALGANPVYQNCTTVALASFYHPSGAGYF